MARMVWKWILVAVTCGAVFAALTIGGLIHGHEHVIGLAMLVGLAIWVGHRYPQVALRNAFAAGAGFAVTALWVQGMFLTLYFQNNPGYQDVPIPFGLGPRAFTLLFSPIGALAAGTFCTLIALPLALAHRLRTHTAEHNRSLRNDL